MASTGTSTGLEVNVDYHSVNQEMKLVDDRSLLTGRAANGDEAVEVVVFTADRLSIAGTKINH